MYLFSAPKSVNAGPAFTWIWCNNPSTFKRMGRWVALVDLVQGPIWKYYQCRYSTWEFFKKYRNSMWNINYLGWTIIWMSEHVFHQHESRSFLEDSLIDLLALGFSQLWSYSKLIKGRGRCYHLDHQTNKLTERQNYATQRAGLPGIGGGLKETTWRVASSS